MASPNLLPADVVLVRTPGFFGKAIRIFGIIATNDADVNHAQIALGNLLAEPQVVESKWRIKRSPLGTKNIVVWRHKTLSDNVRREVAMKAVEACGEHYGFLKIILFVLDAIFHTIWFTRKLGFTNFKVCSNLVGWAYDKTLGGQAFGEPWQSLTPDGIDDYCKRNPKWVKVYSSLE